MRIERGSTTHGRHVDDQMAREVRGRTQGRESPRSEAWHEPEAAGEDQPQPDRIPREGHTAGGAPPGMTSQDVVDRSQFARFLPYRGFPADRDQLVASAAQHQAPETVLGELRGLPGGVSYRSVAEVWAALGHGREDDTHRA